MKYALCRDTRPWIPHNKLQTFKHLAAQRGMSCFLYSGISLIRGLQQLKNTPYRQRPCSRKGPWCRGRTIQLWGWCNLSSCDLFGLQQTNMASKQFTSPPCCAGPCQEFKPCQTERATQLWDCNRFASCSFCRWHGQGVTWVSAKTLESTGSRITGLDRSKT